MGARGARPHGCALCSPIHSDQFTPVLPHLTDQPSRRNGRSDTSEPRGDTLHARGHAISPVQALRELVSKVPAHAGPDLPRLRAAAKTHLHNNPAYARSMQDLQNSLPNRHLSQAAAEEHRARQVGHLLVVQECHKGSQARGVRPLRRISSAIRQSVARMQRVRVATL
jgi:hypothetical protein